MEDILFVQAPTLRNCPGQFHGAWRDVLRSTTAHLLSASHYHAFVCDRFVCWKTFRIVANCLFSMLGSASQEGEALSKWDVVNPIHIATFVLLRVLTPLVCAPTRPTSFFEKERYSCGWLGLLSFDGLRNSQEIALGVLLTSLSWIAFLTSARQTVGHACTSVCQASSCSLSSRIKNSDRFVVDMLLRESRAQVIHPRNTSHRQIRLLELSTLRRWVTNSCNMHVSGVHAVSFSSHPHRGHPVGPERLGCDA